ncbi:MAG: DNA mismatch repair endonuclease MutL, partial [Andreesenia angusta]|nr:DNA mismatch repair endonuclease MutL [Andreesenia angusta]
MDKIKLLDDKTINKIAAGEVVERPVAVVKELVENSIDAMATNISIEIKKGGTKYIRVTDNGIGMNENDLKNAFIRHSTSKISKVEDLGNIITLGFRGEALASISSVSRIEIVSKERKANTGKKIILYGGEIRDEATVGTKDGTTIIVRDLFFNTPVRRGFLKSESAESMAINEFIYRLAISNPGISFNYIKDGKIIIKTPGNGDLKSTIYSVLGSEFIKSTYYFEDKYKEMIIKGYTSNLKYFRGNRSNQYIFINGRVVKSQIISKAIEDIYKERIPIGKFPSFALFLEIDPNNIDVNIHPTKMEVRFREERDLLYGIKKVISERLIKENLIPELRAKDIMSNSISDREKKKVNEKRTQIPVFELIDNEEKKRDKSEDKNDIKLIDEKVVYRKGKEESDYIFGNTIRENKIEK